VANIINMTPHLINIYGADSTQFDASIRKLLVLEGAQPSQTIQPSGTLLNAKQSEVIADAVDGIPCMAFTFTHADALPIGEYDDYYVVSALYVSACKALGLPTNQLLTVRGTVYKSAAEPKPIGCLGFYRN